MPAEVGEVEAIPGRYYRHKRTGGVYLCLGMGRARLHSTTWEDAVFYQGKGDAVLSNPGKEVEIVLYATDPARWKEGFEPLGLQL